MPEFTPIADNNDIRKVIRSAFDTNLALSGAWGYSKAEATIIESIENNIPLTQFEHMITSMRAYLEMNMTREETERYGSINVNERSREQKTLEGKVYDIVHYEITAMKESVYAEFIDAYKEGYGKEDFDLSAHFAQRKEATLVREASHWFEVSQLG